MRKSFVLALLALPLAASSAYAHDGEDPYYLELGLGLVGAASVTPPGVGEVDFDLGISSSVAVGRPFAQTGSIEWALEGEIFYSFFKLDEGDLDSFPGTSSQGSSAFALMANVIADMEVADGLSVYAGAGLGLATNIEYETLSTGNHRQRDKDGTAAQAMVGLKYKIGPQYDVSLGYRFFATEDVSVTDQVSATTNDVEFVNNVFEVSFRWGI